MNVTIFGAGYVGLVTATCLADVGHDVVCVDTDITKIHSLCQGVIPIFEPGLSELVKSNMLAGTLRFTSCLTTAVAHGEVQFIAVGTPSDEDGSADLTHVLAVAQSIGRNLSADATIVNKSTVPVGTAERVRAAISDQLAKRDVELSFDVVSNPEFLKEGDAIRDCMRPDRIVIGTGSAHAIEVMKRLYVPFNRNHERLIIMDTRSAELTKYAANAMLATKISFMNEMANIAERVGADIEKIRQGIGSDARIGYSFIYPGAGYGGSCFPKDVQALERTSRDHGYDAQILRAVERVNQHQKSKLFELIDRHFQGQLHGRTFAVWGLAFKPNTDDVREAPSRALLTSLLDAGARVRAYDPQAMDQIARIFEGREGLELYPDPQSMLHDADALIVVTEWKAFQTPDFAAIKAALHSPVVFDGRNIYDPETVEAAGLAYYGIGRGRSLQPALQGN